MTHRRTVARYFVLICLVTSLRLERSSGNRRRAARSGDSGSQRKGDSVMKTNDLQSGVGNIWRRLFFPWVAAILEVAAFGAPVLAGEFPPSATPTPAGAVAPPGTSRDPSNSPFDYFPLRIGNRWEYRATYRLTGRIAFDATAVLTIEGSERLGARTYFKAVCKVTGVLSNPTTVSYYRPAAEGIWQADVDDGKVTESLLLPAPLAPGTKWNTSLRDDVFFGRVAARQEARPGGSVQCGSRLFRNCVQISSDVDSKVGKVRQDQWLAPGVGVVKQTQQGPFWSMESVLTGFRGAEAPRSPDSKPVGGAP